MRKTEKNAMTKGIENTVANMTVAEMRKEAGKHNIKNASKYKRVELQQMLIDTLVAEQSKTTTKRAKAEKVESDDITTLAEEMLEGIEMLSDDDLMQTNRKVLIQVMKMLHCSKWYRTYDKATMVKKIQEAVAQEVNMVRKLEDFEKPFWNGTSISILEDAGFVLEINDGGIVGIGNVSE